MVLNSDFPFKKQLLDEAEHDIKIYPDRDQYYLLKSEKGRLSLLLENRPHTKNKENSN